METSDDDKRLDPVEDLGLTEAEVRGVAKRPIKGSLRNFLHDMKTLLSFAALKRAVQEFQSDDALGLAAQLAYYLILALFPFILFLVAVLDTFSNPEFARGVLVYLEQVLPQQVFEIIEGYIGQFLGSESSAPGLLSVGILGTIWAASGAFSAIINALNKAYDVEETRPYWKVKGIAILMTVGLSGLIVAGVLLLVAGPPIGEAIAGYFGLGEEFKVAWSIARWPAALLFLVLTVALIYYASRNLAALTDSTLEGRSDHGPFAAEGVPVGGLFTGAEGTKTEEEARLFGGEAGEPHDPCYHEACDTLDNLSPRALDEMSDAAAHATVVLAEE